MPSIVYVDSTRNELAGDDAGRQLRALRGRPEPGSVDVVAEELPDRPGSAGRLLGVGQRHTIPQLVAIILRQLKVANDERSVST